MTGKRVTDASPTFRVAGFLFGVLLMTVIWAASDATVIFLACFLLLVTIVALGELGVILMALGFAAAIFAHAPAGAVTIKQPIDACRGGIVQQSDGEKWYPVTLPRKSYYYDGKKYQPDHPAGHVRTIPCGEK